MKSSHYKACIFDFDYTLGDATAGIVLCANYALEQMNFTQCATEDIRKTVGLTLPETFEQLTKTSDPLLGGRFAKLFKEEADRVMLSNTKLFSDTVQTLNSLKNNGMRIGIVTTKFHYRIDEILRKFNIEQLIDIVIGGEDVQKAKPDPEGLLHAIEELRLSKEDVVYIGDSIVDARTAYNANVDFIAVTTGATNKESFFDYPYTHIIRSLDQLMQ